MSGAMNRYRKDSELINAVPWTDDVVWDGEIVIQADTYKSYNLFPEAVVTAKRDGAEIARGAVYSPSRRYAYSIRLLPKGLAMWIAEGWKRGSAVFDGPVEIPILHEQDRDGTFNFLKMPWMSLTPMEVLTLRPGTRLAHGHTVIGGLGLGYQLMQVAKVPQVSRITLVEQSQELVDWILPRLQKHLQRVNDNEVVLDVHVGDAMKIIPELTADVALIDIYPKHGGNTFVPCPHIPCVWVWGSEILGM